jgi:tetratricopeptide (TPR) repeat protein
VVEFAQCCEKRELKWTNSKVADRWADLYICSSCGHVHKMESWLIPLDWPGDDRCVNCGGNYKEPKKTKKGEVPELRCEHCGLTPDKDLELHRTLGALHPEGDWLQGSLLAIDLGRHVLGLKLASAAARWGDEDNTLARTVRLQALVSINQIDRALDEAYGWARKGAPPVLWPMIAELEGEVGNVEGAAKALRYGVEVDPTNIGLWADYAELAAASDDRPHALQAAQRLLSHAEHRHRGLAVISDIAEKFYDESALYNAIETMALAGDHQERNVAMAWLQAQIAGRQGDEEGALKWLETVLSLDPEHAGAKAAMQKIRPAKKKGWLPWR